jgi:hypothetical protein
VSLERDGCEKCWTDSRVGLQRDGSMDAVDAVL